ncbi:glycoside hydrolase family 64 protein [Hyaloscypha variabilis F]|uniref:Glycoside hydrolase family 64 protein n=1 Tax=Hyaloscypha variabilis (strain UAMH 11265 / GT02V1 / F) TaxID=1149755 RepID=A0A2J6RI21_HYAVF|nr:glycoside hydrolase family 64 protein [Hyaloscypha variabilis F]
MSTAQTINFALRNGTTSSTVYAYVTGQAINNNYALFILQADGETAYYPVSPSSNGSPLAVPCDIPLGPPGSTTTITVPQLSGARLWFSVNDKLTFLLNPGPGLVEPSVSAPSDPNYNKTWDFCEFTFNQYQLFANITYVDFVSLPISLSLLNTSGVTQSVTGIPADGLDTICAGLQAQNAIDGAGWNQLIVTNNGVNLRALSPNSGCVMNPSLFLGYYSSYVDAVWAKYTNTPLTVDTQNEWETVEGTVVNNLLTFPGVGTFAQPAAADIFSCSTGPFAADPTNTAEMGAIGARIAAAFNRSTLLIDSQQPDGEIESTFYQTSPTNHYSRIVHAANTDGEGYAFPYDDVGPSDGPDLSGAVYDGSPALLTVNVGGG